MNVKEYLQNYWNQYLLIEKEFLKSSLYVAFDNDNLNTYSSFFLKLILEIGSEIDNVFRETCNHTGRSDISAYVIPILTKYPSIVNQSVQVKDSNICITPFDGWNSTQPSQSLDFWNRYNEIKHNRIAKYKEASLKTAVTALAGLYILLMYRLNELYNTDQTAFSNYPDGNESKLFLLAGWACHLRTANIKSNYSIFDDSDGGKKII